MPLRWPTGAVLAWTATLTLAFAAPAAAHHAPLADQGLSEAELHAFESFVLGPEHAAEHARQRELERSTEMAPAVSGAKLDPLAGRLERGALELPAGAYDEPELEAAVDDDPRAEVGEWGEPFATPLYAIHAALLPTGKVLWFGPMESSATAETTAAVLWDPATGDLERVDPPLLDGQPANIYCAGQAFLATGELLVAGGTLERLSNGDPLGLKKVYTFDPFEEEWVEQPEMEHGRWYPTNVQLPDGRQAIMSGSDEFGASEEDYNETVEIFTPGATLQAQGSLTTLVDEHGDPAERGPAGPAPTGGLYPHMFVMPSGKTLVAGPFQQDSWYLHTPDADNRLVATDIDDLDWRRRYASGVILPPPPGDTSPSEKVMLLGGYGSNPGEPEHQVSLQTTEYFDESDPLQKWQYGPETAVARSNQNTVLLPDGSMVQVGGGVGADLYGTVPEHHNVELWDPVTEQWSLGAAQDEARAYHSTALLLPDGRVVSSGDDGNTKALLDVDTAEVYSPPYLFKGPRPTIAAAPGAIELGAPFHVQTPDGDIASAALIAPGATTHANDMHQRYVPLQVTQGTGGVQLTPPVSGYAAPPGYYMLFIVNEAGVPSIAKFVQLTPAGAPSGPGPGGPPGGDPPPSNPSPPAPPDDPEPPKPSKAKATGAAKSMLAKKLANGSREARRKVKVDCRPRRGGFRCAFRLKRMYKGVLLVRETGGGLRIGRMSFRGNCGRLGRRGPFAIKTRNVKCPAARRALRRWHLGGKPLPRAYDCRERPGPRRMTCRAGKRLFTFKQRA